jgi:DASS family divalent anion:Na+ symporter
MSRDEKITFATILGAVVLWVFGDALGVAPVLAAMVALSTLLATGVLSWRDCLTYSPAWDTLTWFAILVSMSSALNETGLIGAFASAVGTALSAMKLHWTAVFGILHTAFFALHYLFASQTAHIGALYAAFLAMMMAAGVPPVLAAVTLGYNGNLFGSLTHYSSGQAAIYYGSGYMTLPEVFKFGAIMGVRHLLTWGVFGMAWWKVLGWW